MALVSSRMRSSVMMPLPWAAVVLSPDRFRREHGGTSARDQGFIPVAPRLPNTPGRSGRQLHPLVPLLLELVAQNLAAIALGHIRDDHDVLGHLRRRQVRPAVLYHGGLGQACRRP